MINENQNRQGELNAHIETVLGNLQASQDSLKKMFLSLSNRVERLHDSRGSSAGSATSRASTRIKARQPPTDDRYRSRPFSHGEVAYPGPSELPMHALTTHVPEPRSVTTFLARVRQPRSTDTSLQVASFLY